MSELSLRKNLLGFEVHYGEGRPRTLSREGRATLPILALFRTDLHLLAR